MENNNSSHESTIQVLVVYKECQHNHAAPLVSNVLDGCCLFEASGPCGTPGAMLCAACHCHRNFHTSVEVVLPQHHETQMQSYSFAPQPQQAFRCPAPAGPEITHSPPRPHVHCEAFTRANDAPYSAPSPSVRRADLIQPRGLSNVGSSRTRGKRLTKAQGERVRAIVEGNNWRRFGKYTKDEVDRICSEIGIKRRCLKDWIYNHKHERKTSESDSI